MVVVDDGAGAGGMVALAPALGKLAALASLDLSGTSVVMECVVAASTLPVCYSVVMCVAVAVAVAVVVCMYGCVRAAVCGCFVLLVATGNRLCVAARTVLFDWLLRRAAAGMPRPVVACDDPLHDVDVVHALPRQRVGGMHGNVGFGAVVVIGDTAAGKSSLVDRLVHGTFDQHKPMTAGVQAGTLPRNVTPPHTIHGHALAAWCLLLTDVSLSRHCTCCFTDRLRLHDGGGALTPRQPPVDVTIYDCGGQPVPYLGYPLYYLDLRVFCSPKTIYVIVCHARHPNPAPYLRLVAARAPKAPVVMVVTHMDETCGATVDIAHLCGAHPLAYATPSPLLASNKTGEGVDAIRSTLASAMRPWAGRSAATQVHHEFAELHGLEHGHAELGALQHDLAGLVQDAVELEDPPL